MEGRRGLLEKKVRIVGFLQQFKKIIKRGYVKKMYSKNNTKTLTIKINGWLYEEYEKFWGKNGRAPGKPQKEIIINNVCSRIEEAEIWLPLDELYSYYESHINKFRKRYEKNNGAEC